MVALGRDDGGHATPAQALAQTFIGRNLRDLRFAEPARGVDDKAPAFQRVMADRDLDLIGEYLPDQRSRELSDVDFFVLCHQPIEGERIVVLPAGERTSPAAGGF